ncbi:hypothetical protein [Sphaerisporangium aureirubrum]|uniref:Uncharacterized protein n=1 Tax=Sphaerisporangium aureirubrum TaxID=1544736 RepID=A0ABW1NP37_9ACTN
MRLWTVQHRAVLDVLEGSGELVGDWARMMIGSYRPAYVEMVAEMARRGVGCAGRPPVWAWSGPDTRDDRVALTAELLLCPEAPEEYARYVIIDLEVPGELVVLSSYGRWNDYLDAVLAGGGSARMDWTIDPEEFERSAYAGVQACLPRLDGQWVLSVRPFEPSDEPDESGAEAGGLASPHGAAPAPAAGPQ